MNNDYENALYEYKKLLNINYYNYYYQIPKRMKSYLPSINIKAIKLTKKNYINKLFFYV